MDKACWPVRPNQHGASLIEALIAVLLMGLALLGFALMQMETLQANNESFARTEARILLVGMAERIQANPEGQYSGSNTKTATEQQAVTSDDALAAHDVWSWQQRLANSRLPESIGIITESGGQLDLTLSWQAAADRGSSGDTDSQTLTETLQIRIAP
ncbi:type IV pilus modification protein PilV [Cobetia amphilecti]|uniref:type IV pilus modification protein PilV n=1 Tax=Cobetia amphilecti TaxID=1055104 RepID=UPI00254B529B|nr:type IV pilus modification protein PilV [Cobetia amphilecti]